MYTCLAVISSDSVFEDDRIFIAVSSSKILPSELDNTSSILSSISFS